MPVNGYGVFMFEPKNQEVWIPLQDTPMANFTANSANQTAQEKILENAIQEVCANLK
jgi:hypothetical protein